MPVGHRVLEKWVDSSWNSTIDSASATAWLRRMAGSWTMIIPMPRSPAHHGNARATSDARLGLFDVVIAESLDRISRDQEDTSYFYKQLQYRDIRIVTSSQGEISEMHIGFNGAVSAVFLRDLVAKVHRGLEGRVRKGKSAGGVSYGYRVTRAFREDGTTVTRRRPSGRSVMK